ncbi:hypothetical protein WN944_028672 [Citrus x changshan-huyou]|uniref:Uncharacterized protein n=1 Tax=Citrus x changshan-huyou TaxID=2935761 RepID=A0AAP0LL08_9ROSI
MNDNLTFIRLQSWLSVTQIMAAASASVSSPWLQSLLQCYATENETRRRAGATDWRGCVLVSDHELWRSAVRVFSFLLGMRIDLTGIGH